MSWEDDLISEWRHRARTVFPLSDVDPEDIRAEATRLLNLMNDLKKGVSGTAIRSLRNDINSRYHLLSWMIVEKMREDPDSVRLMIASGRKIQDGMRKLGKFLAVYGHGD